MRNIKNYLTDKYDSYHTLLVHPVRKEYHATGTCAPFSREIFLSARGLILPCERISHSYSLGKIKNGRIDIDFEEAAKQFNYYYNEAFKSCLICANSEFCTKGIFTCFNFNKQTSCSEIISKSKYDNFIKDLIDFFEKKPSKIIEIIKEG